MKGRRAWTQALIRLSIAVLALSALAHPGGASEPLLVVRLIGGEGGTYPLSEVECASFVSDSLRIVTSAGTDAYLVASIRRLELLTEDDWAGVDDPPDAAGILEVVHLFQNQPNPFSPGTVIAYEIPVAGQTSLRIYTPSGRLVRRLVDARRAVGRHTAHWDGRDDAGRRIASGVYFYALSAPGVEENRRMILLR
jgi:hypothetical protein